MTSKQDEKQARLRLAVSIRAVCMKDASRHDVRTVAQHLARLSKGTPYQSPGLRLIAGQSGRVKYGELVSLCAMLAQKAPLLEKREPELWKMVGAVVAANAQQGLY